MQLPIFHADKCSSAVILLSSGVSTASLSLICYNLIFLSSGISAASLSHLLYPHFHLFGGLSCHSIFYLLQPQFGSQLPFICTNRYFSAVKSLVFLYQLEWCTWHGVHLLNGIAQWRYSFYLSSYSCYSQESLNTAWLVMHSSYLHLRERLADRGHHASAVKQNLCCLMCSVCLHNCLIALAYIDIIMVGTHSSSCLF